MILAHNGISFYKSFWYINAYMHCDSVLYRKEGGSTIWEELVDGAWEELDSIECKECEEKLKEYIRPKQ